MKRFMLIALIGILAAGGITLTTCEEAQLKLKEAFEQMPEMPQDEQLEPSEPKEENF